MDGKMIMALSFATEVPNLHDINIEGNEIGEKQNNELGKWA
jgi:hypothetical protein